MPNYNLTGQKIKDTYSQLAQVSGSTLVNGLGVAAPITTASITNFPTEVSRSAAAAGFGQGTGGVSEATFTAYTSSNNAIVSAITTRVNSMESATGSYALKTAISGAFTLPSGVVSSSAQINLAQTQGTASWATNAISASYALNSTTPSLQQVTDVASITTNTINANSFSGSFGELSYSTTGGARLLLESKGVVGQILVLRQNSIDALSINDGDVEVAYGRLSGQELYSVTNIIALGYVTASTYYGDGSNLDNVTIQFVDVDSIGISIGSASNAAGTEVISIGNNSYSTGQDAIAIGTDSYSSGATSLAIGSNARATSSRNTAIGWNSNSTGSISIAIGENVLSAGLTSIAIGASATASGDYAVSIGNGSESGRTGGVAIGRSAGTSNQNDGIVSIGDNSSINDSYAVAVGANSVGGYQAAALGYGASSTGGYGVSLGAGSSATQNYAVALGANVVASVQDYTTTKYLQLTNVSSSMGQYGYANDSAAGTAGVPLGGVYHTSGSLKIRMV